MLLVKKFFRIDWIKTILVNLLTLPIDQACRLPIVVNYGCKIHLGGGRIIFDCPIQFGVLRLGSRSASIVDVRYERTFFFNQGRVILKGNAWIGAGSRVIVSEDGVLTLGEGLKITGRSTIICKKSISIGRDCLFSWDIQIMDTDFHKIYDETGGLINRNSDIKIGNHVWICARSTVLKGSSIPSNTILAAGSVFVGNRAEEDCIYGGSGRMLTVIKRNVKWSDV